MAPVPTEVVQVVCRSTARSHSWTGSGAQQVLLLGAGPARDDEHVGCRDLVEDGVGDEGQALGVAANRAALLADHDRLRAGQSAEHLVRADGVEGRHVVVGEDGDLHAATLDLSARVPHRAPPLRSTSGHADPLRDGGGVDPAADAELAQDVGDVDAGGLLRDEELGPDLPIRLAHGDEGEDFSLP